jgi:L-lysine 2,3-aminomutase
MKSHYDRNKDYYISKKDLRKQDLRAVNRPQMIAYLQEHPCIDCQETDIRTLDFDHVRGKKKCNVSRMVDYHKWETILQEIAKCEVRCANCHRKKTSTDFGYYKAS